MDFLFTYDHRSFIQESLEREIRGSKNCLRHIFIITYVSFAELTLCRSTKDRERERERERNTNSLFIKTRRLNYKFHTKWQVVNVWRRTMTLKKTTTIVNKIIFSSFCFAVYLFSQYFEANVAIKLSNINLSSGSKIRRYFEHSIFIFAFQLFIFSKNKYLRRQNTLSVPQQNYHFMDRL